MTVKVGQDPVEDFFLPEDAIRKYSDFFKAALDKKWKEGQTLVIELPEDDAGVFVEYAQWLCEGKLDLKLPASDVSNYMDEMSFLELTLAHCYIFGEKVMDAKFCNEVLRGMTSLIEHHENIPSKTTSFYKAWAPEDEPFDVENTIYFSTASGSPVRRFFVDYWVNASHNGYQARETDYMHRDFARDLARSFMALHKRGKWAPFSSLPKAGWFKDE